MGLNTSSENLDRSLPYTYIHCITQNLNAWLNINDIRVCTACCIGFERKNDNNKYKQKQKIVITVKQEFATQTSQNDHYD